MEVGGDEEMIYLTDTSIMDLEDDRNIIRSDDEVDNQKIIVHDDDIDSGKDEYDTTDSRNESRCREREFVAIRRC